MFSNEKNIEILKRALDVIEEEEIASLPSKEELAKITFSPEFERKMERLIRRERKPYYRLINTAGKRVACWVIGAIIALTAVTFGVEAIREPVIEFFVKTFEKFSIIFYNEEVADNNPIIEEYYAPTYLPEGYSKSSEEKVLTMYNIHYVSDNGAQIHFKQSVIDVSSLYLDTEDTSVEKIRMLDNTAYFINKDNMNKVFWHNEQYSFTITSVTEIEKEELIKIAESIRIAK